MRDEPILWLDSQDASHPQATISWLATKPDVTLTYRDGLAKVSYPGGSREWSTDAWHALRYVRETWPGWWGGYLGYDLKNDVEALDSHNQDLVNAPDLHMSRWTQIVPYDAGSPLPFNIGAFKMTDPEPIITREAYMQAIETAKRHIVEGDIYELNLSHPLVASVEGDAKGLYAAMRRVGPVPFGAFMQVDGLAICSASPERFLSLNNGVLRSDPIKGTVARGTDADHDETLRQSLHSSEKNRAENLMIVDLVRNDLSVVCEPGSVKVESLFDIQSFNTVHQMVSTVTGRKRKDITPEEAIKACFPMGSMTGAPKISAMKRIEELETWRRGIYSGAIGYIAPDGEFSFNVVIRTAILRHGRLVYGVGGAITSDSDAEAEWDETLIKAKALVNAM